MHGRSAQYNVSQRNEDHSDSLDGGSFKMHNSGKPQLQSIKRRESSDIGPEIVRSSGEGFRRDLSSMPYPKDNTSSSTIGPVETQVSSHTFSFSTYWCELLLFDVVVVVVLFFDFPCVFPLFVDFRSSSPLIVLCSKS